MKTKNVFSYLLLVLILPATSSWGDEPLDIAGTYTRIVSDYQRIAASIQNASARTSLDQLTSDAYRLLIQQATGIKKLSSDDLYALGACNEAIDEINKAKQLYAASLAKSATVKTHLALTRVNVQDNLAEAEKHFAAAVKQQPEHPELSRYRLLLLSAHQRNRDWAGAIPHLKYLLEYTKTLADNSPANSQLKSNHTSVKQQLDRIRQFAKMKGNTAPALNMKNRIQGKAFKLQALKGKVVVLDIFAMWSGLSHDRMELLKKLNKKHAGRDLEIVGVTLPYEQKYDAKSDALTKQSGLSPEKEATFVAAFAKKHGILWQLGFIDLETVNKYGVATLPHTVVIDQKGQIVAILLGDDKNGKDLETIVAGLLK